MTLVFHPHVGVGPIRFGMSRADVERLLGPAESEMPPDPFVGDTTLYFSSTSLSVHLETSGQVCAIQSLSSELVFDGRNLRLETWSSLKAFVVRRDPDATIDPDGSAITSRHLGLAANSSDELTPEGILAFRAGYYDRQRRDKVDMEGWLAAIGAMRAGK